MDSEGKEIVGDSVTTKQIYKTNAARIMTEALTGVMINGTAKGLGLTNTISAGKTGTTDEKKDGWFVGYTPYYTTSVWVGYDLPKEVENLKGATYPGTIWHNFMEQLHISTMTNQFELYDWRTPLKEAQEAEEKRKAEEEARIAEEEARIAEEEANKVLEETTQEDTLQEGQTTEEEVQGEETQGGF
jgi:membrane peptidoglycan carboxypeptidase